MFSSCRSSQCKSLFVSISRFEMRILDFLLGMSLDHELQSAIIIPFSPNVVSLQRRHATSISNLRLPLSKFAKWSVPFSKRVDEIWWMDARCFVLEP